MCRNQKFYVWVLILCCSPLVWGFVQEQSKDAEASKSTEQRLIKMELLNVGKGPMPMPKRNIFTLRRTNVSEELSQEEIQERIQGAVNSRNRAPEVENKTLPLNLRYLGYVLSDQRTVGLIVFQGETLAVLEGDLIDESYKVGRIGREEIEVLGPDSKPVMFSLEGESP